MSKLEKLLKEIESRHKNTEAMWDESQKLIYFPKPLSGWSFIGDEFWTTDFPLQLQDLITLRDWLNENLQEVNP